MSDVIAHMMCYFFVYSFLGWAWETLYCSIRAKHFVYRGFLIGPYCPIYGIGIVSVLYLLMPFRQHLGLVYLLATVLVTLLEYATSYGLEKLFHASWWDYTDMPFNLNGRIALPVSLFWGIGCLLMIKIVHPQVIRLTDTFLQRFGQTPIDLLLGLLLIDLGYTLVNLQNFKRVVAELSTALDEKKESLRADLVQFKNEHTKRLSENAIVTTISARLSKHQRRLIHNYPNLKLKKIKNREEIQRLLKRRS